MGLLHCHRHSFTMELDGRDRPVISTQSNTTPTRGPMWVARPRRTHVKEMNVFPSSHEQSRQIKRWQTWIGRHGQVTSKSIERRPRFKLMTTMRAGFRVGSETIRGGEISDYARTPMRCMEYLTPGPNLFFSRRHR